MKLLIEYDGSDSADSALYNVTHAGLPATGEALVMTVAEAWLPPPPPSAAEVVELAAQAHGPLGLERKYMASSQAVLEAGTDDNQHEIRCGMCARELYVDEEAYTYYTEALVSGLDNPYRCEVCSEEYDDLAYEG